MAKKTTKRASTKAKTAAAKAAGQTAAPANPMQSPAGLSAGSESPTAGGAQPAANPTPNGGQPAASIIPAKRTSFPVPPFSALTMMIFGIPGAGKTRFLAGDPDTLFLATEPGQQFTKGGVVDIANFQTFQSVVKELAEQRKQNRLEYRSVVIDIVDNLNTMCRDYVCQQKGLAYPSEKDFGKTWAECNKTWTAWLGSLMRITNVRFVTHCNTQSVEIQNDAGILEEIDRFVPTFSGNKAAQYLDGVVNAVGFITQAKNGQRVIGFQQSPRVAAKDRTDILSQLGWIALPNQPDLGFKTVADAYAAKATELGFTISQ